MVSDGGSHIGDLTTSHNDLAVNHGYSEDELFRLFPTGTFQLCDILIHIVICPESTGMPPATGVKIIRCQDTVWIVATSSDDVCELWGFPKKDCLFIFWMVYTIEFLRLFGSVFIRLTAAIFAASRIPLALDLMDLVTLWTSEIVATSADKKRGFKCCHAVAWLQELPAALLTSRGWGWPGAVCAKRLDHSDILWPDAERILLKAILVFSDVHNIAMSLTMFLGSPKTSHLRRMEVREFNFRDTTTYTLLLLNIAMV